ncbi:12840_t:CDS:2, partial [Cetraspora pellucida]
MIITKLPKEIFPHIFKYIKPLIHVMLTCKLFSDVITNLQFKKIWILSQFGKSHVLFYAVRLGPNFIDIDFTKIIIKETGISRYFIQRLSLTIGTINPVLLEHKCKHRSVPTNLPSPNNKFKKWGSDLPLQNNIGYDCKDISDLVFQGLALVIIPIN